MFLMQSSREDSKEDATWLVRGPDTVCTEKENVIQHKVYVLRTCLVVLMSAYLKVP